MLFSLFYMSARIRFKLRIIKKTCVFFYPARALDCCRFWKKTVNFRDKKTFRKKNKFISRDKKYSSSYVFLLVFLSPSLTFLFCPPDTRFEIRALAV